MGYRHAVVVTPSDTVSLAAVSRIWVGGAGNLKVKTEGGDTLIISGLQTGSMTPDGLGIIQVFNTDTTATLIVAVW